MYWPILIINCVIGYLIGKEIVKIIELIHKKVRD